MSQEDFRLKHPTRSDELRAQRGEGAELPAPVQNRRQTFSGTLGDAYRALRRLPTREQEALLAIEERPVDASRIAPNQRAVVERFQTVEHIDAPNVHNLAPHLAARREQLELERTAWMDFLDRIRTRPLWIDAALMIGFSLAVLGYVLGKFVL